MTTGIFVRTVAEAAEEERREGKSKITPYWRTVKSDGSLNEKYPGGVAAQAARLREEGIEIDESRKIPRVAALSPSKNKNANQKKSGGTMVTSAATTVKEYLAGLPADRRKAIEAVRKVISP